jgi:p-hydroxybenzoate 3-monooxygenase
LDDRLKLNGMVDSGLNIRFRGRTIRLDLPGLIGKCVMIYGQQEGVKDLVAARLAAGQPLLFEATAMALDGLDGNRPNVRYRIGCDGASQTLECDFVAGCDGYHGVSRTFVPTQTTQTYERSYDFAWLGVLARAKPMADMTYSNSDRGFALCSRRSMEISRL